MIVAVQFFMYELNKNQIMPQITRNCSQCQYPYAVQSHWGGEHPSTNPT